MNTINPEVFKFYRALEKNNNREWFEPQKERFKVLEAEIKTFNDGVKTGKEKSKKTNLVDELEALDMSDEKCEDVLVRYYGPPNEEAAIQLYRRLSMVTQRFLRLFWLKMKLCMAQVSCRNLPMIYLRQLKIFGLSLPLRFHLLI